MMAVVSVVTILAVLAPPSFTTLFEPWRVRIAANDLHPQIAMRAQKRLSDATVSPFKLLANGEMAETILQTSPAASIVAMTQFSATSTLYAALWGMISETSGGAPAVGMNFVLHPSGKSTIVASAIQLCTAGSRRVVQVKQGASYP